MFTPLWEHEARAEMQYRTERLSAPAPARRVRRPLWWARRRTARSAEPVLTPAPVTVPLTVPPAAVPVAPATGGAALAG